MSTPSSSVPAAAQSSPERGPSAGFAIFAGLAASLVAIGLARFAYTPLIPLLIGARWFGAGDVVYLGAANFAGYFAGALAGRALGRRFGNRAMLRLMMALASLAFLACAVPLSLAWFFGWRFLSGFAGAVVMVLVAQTILPHVAPERRGTASGAIFMGIGGGIVASGTLVPLLLHAGLRATWIGLGLCSAVLTLLTWRAWPAAHPPASPSPTDAHAARQEARRTPAAVRLLYGEYALVAVGLVPAAVFLVDFVARGLGQGAAVGALYWIVYGAGAMCGPLLYGLVADRTGFGPALRIGLLLSGLASLGLALLHWTPALVVASFLMGAFTPGVVTLMIGRLHELLPGDHAAQHASWGRSTTVFALFQALSGYGFSFLFAHTGGAYLPIYACAAAAFALALAADLLAQRSRP
jgi:predicted MFS family arabinose efflux permease